jgi:hypothetical protein
MIFLHSGKVETISRSMSEIGFWPNPILFKRMRRDFQTIPVPFHLIAFQNIILFWAKNDLDFQNRLVVNGN